MIDALEELERAYQCWCAWHNPMSRRWLRECIMEYRLAQVVYDCRNNLLSIQR